MSVSDKEADRLPVAVGENVTVITQLLFTVNELGQVVVSAKSPALAPENAMPLRLREALPVLLRVTDCGALVEPTNTPA